MRESLFCLLFGFACWIGTPGILLGATLYADQSIPQNCTGGNYSIAQRDCTGSDGNAYTTVQEALDSMSRGDKLLIREGVYLEGHIEIPESINGLSWSEGDYNTIASFPGEWAVLDGGNNCGENNDYPLGVLGNRFGVAIRYWLIERLEIRNGGNWSSPDSATGIQISRGPFRLRYCYIHDNLSSSSGDNPSGIQGDRWEDSSIEFCYFKDNGSTTSSHHNFCHIHPFGDYSVGETGTPDAGYHDTAALRRNVYRYNLFDGGAVGIKHKGSQLFTSRRNMDRTYQAYGDKIEHNIFRNLSNVAIRVKQDFCQVYNNIVDGAEGGILGGYERRIYGIVVYNNTIINSNYHDCDEDTLSFQRQTNRGYSYENIPYDGDDFNNIIDQGGDTWMGTEFTFGFSYEDVLPSSWSGYSAQNNFFYRPLTGSQDSDGTLAFCVAGDGSRNRYRISEYEQAYPSASNNRLKHYEAGNPLYLGTTGADAYITRGTYLLDASTTIANGGRGGAHPYLAGVTIPSYVGATDPDNHCWVAGVLSLSDVDELKMGGAGDPGWVDCLQDDVPPRAPANLEVQPVIF